MSHGYVMLDKPEMVHTSAVQLFFSLWSTKSHAFPILSSSFRWSIPSNVFFGTWKSHASQDAKKRLEQKEDFQRQVPSIFHQWWCLDMFGMTAVTLLQTMGKPWENHGKTMGKPWENPGKMEVYSLAMTNSLLWTMTIEIVIFFPLINGDLNHSYVTNYQRVVLRER